MKTSFVKYLLPILAFFFVCLKLTAGESAWTQYVLKNQLIPNSTKIKVIEPRDIQSYNSLVEYRTKVSLIYGREDHSDISNAASWEYDVVYSISFYDKNYKLMEGPFTNRKLTLLGGNTNPVYEIIDLYDLATHNYPIVEVTITGTNAHNTSVPNDVRLEVTIEAVTVSILYDFANFNLGANSNTIYWSFLPGAEYYQVERVFVDSEDDATLAQITSSDLAFTLKEPVRVNTSLQYYELNMTYSSGVVYCRVRPVGRLMVQGGSENEKYGKWKYCTPVIITNGGLGQNAAFESNKNWQYVTTYAEEGKHKKVMSFYDGSLRSRQMATNVSSDNNTVVAETKYDYEGRGVVNILPVPVNGISLGYRPNLNSFQGVNNKTAYDNDVLTGTSALNNSSGSSKYYSINNDVETLLEDFIPDAEGYPFSQTKFTRDGTGRVTQASGVGSKMRLADLTQGTKFTQMFYGNANSTELHRLFGSNVGKSEHYTKQLTIDPNGQLSITFRDQEQRVIATALTGDSPLNVEALSKDLDYLTVSMDGNNIVDKSNHVSRSVSTILNTVQNTQYIFDYSLTGIINDLPDYDLCEECAYDLKITITDPDGVLIPVADIKNIKPNLASCAAGTFDFDGLTAYTIVFPKIGDYTVVKELKLASGAIDALITKLTEDGVGLPDSTTYANQYLALVDYSSCNITCEQKYYDIVKAAHPTWSEEAIQAEVVIQVELNCGAYIDGLIDDPTLDPCSGMLEEMKQQLSPNGIYYPTAENPSTVELQAALLRSPSTWNALDGVSTFARPSLTDLLSKEIYNDDWSMNLVKGHLEYCHYNFCVTNRPSSRFDLKMGLIKDWSEAQLKGYLDPVFMLGGSGSSTKRDPYWQFINPGKRDLIEDQMENYTLHIGLDNNELNTLLSLIGGGSIIQYDTDNNGVISLWEYVNSPLPYGGPPAKIPTDEGKWQLFRSLYLGLKIAIQEDRKEQQNCDYLNLTTYPFAVVRTPLLPTDPDEANALANSQMMQSCASGCDDNVDVWISQIKNNCRELTATEEATIRTNLQAYCLSVCGWENPLGVILDGSIASNTHLSTVQSLLSCPLEGVITVANFYQCTNQVGERQLTSQAHEYMTALNNILQKGTNQVFDHTVTLLPGSNIVSTCLPNNWQEGQTLRIVDGTRTDVWTYIDLDESDRGNGWNECILDSPLKTKVFFSLTYNTLVTTSDGSPIMKIAVSNPFGLYVSPEPNYPFDKLAAPSNDCVYNNNNKFYNEIKLFDFNFQNPYTFALNDGFSTQYGAVSKFESLGNPAIEYSSDPYIWDNSFYHGITFDVQIKQFGATLNKKAYLAGWNTGPHYPYSAMLCIPFKTLPDSICIVNSFTTCTADPIVEEQSIMLMSSIPINPTCPEQPASGILTIPTNVNGNGGSLITNHLVDFSTNTDWYLPNGQLADISTMWSGAFVDLIYQCSGLSPFYDLCPSSISTGDILIPGKEYTLSYYFKTGDLRVRNGGKILGLHTWPTQIGQPGYNTVFTVTFKAVSTKITFEAYGTGYTSVLPPNCVNNCAGRSSVQFNDVDIVEAYPAVSCLNILEDGVNILPNCIPYTTANTTTADLATALNALVDIDYTFSAVNNILTITAKAGFGKEKNGTLISLISTNDGTYVNPTIVDDVILNGGLNLGECCEKPFEIPFDPTKYKNQCKEDLDAIAIHNAWVAWQQDLAGVLEEQIALHINKCFDDPFGEHFQYKYQNNEYHYTLYYYDQADNLVQTVPPAGVNPLHSSQFNADGTYNSIHEPDHHLLTIYKYNSLNQLISQSTPDGGKTWFFYDGKGQLRLSHNAKQFLASSAAANVYSYTKYDAQGRIVQVGEIKDLDKTLAYLQDPIYEKEVLAMLNNGNFPTSTNQLAELTITQYDAGVSDQKNVRGRVASTYSQSIAGTTDASTLYSYDEHGNVDKITQEIQGFNPKTTEYEYDLISGKVNKVFYQKGAVDQFAHRYKYDADNRITSVLTSSNGLIWEEDARYFYYKHGPLARVEIGQDKVQGMDYVYTLQGWLKGVNIPTPRRTLLVAGNTLYRNNGDLGLDGLNPPICGSCSYSQSGVTTLATNTNLHRYVAQDEFAYNLSYYKGDYKATSLFPVGSSGGTQGISAVTDVFNNNLQNGILQEGLYNGNIVSMITQTHNLEALQPSGAVMGDNRGLRANAYRYDQLNRLTNARSYDIQLSAPNSTWENRTSALNAHAYDASYSYDPNGNITHARVNGSAASLMDNLSYQYDYFESNSLFTGLPKNWLRSNRLYHVNDAVTTAQTDDLENQGVFTANANTPYELIPSPGVINSANNYSYDGIGNLVKDLSEEIATIRWTVYGKVAEVIRTNGSTKPNLLFKYDASGNRVVKIVKPAGQLDPTKWDYTYYVRDASGNVMAIYEVSENANSTEYSVYGSSRLGTFSKATSSNGGGSGGGGNTTPIPVIPAYNGPVYNSVTDITLPNGGGWYTVNSGQRAFVRPGVTYTGGIQLNSGATLVIEGNWNGGYVGMNTNTTLWVASSGSYSVPNWSLNGGEVKNWGTVTIPDIYIQNNGKLFNYGTLINTTKITTADGNGNQVTNLSTWTINDIQTGGAIVNEGNLTITTISNTYNNGTFTNLGTITATNASFEIWNNATLTLGAGSMLAVKNFRLGKALIGPATTYAQLNVSAITELQLNSTLSGKVKICDVNNIEINQSTSVGPDIKLDCNFVLPTTPPSGGSSAGLIERRPILKRYELSNHLGNVYAVLNGLKLGVDTATTNGGVFVSNTLDSKADYYTASVENLNDYYAFGQSITNRSFTSSAYRYGFNGKEKDLEGMGGGGSTYDYGFRIYNPSLGRFLSIDPMIRKFPMLTPYQYSSNTPIQAIDLDGLEAINVQTGEVIDMGTQENLIGLLNSNISLWQDLFDWELSDKYEQVLSDVTDWSLNDAQRMADASGSEVNTDYHAVKIGKLPNNMTEKDLYDLIRKNFATIMEGNGIADLHVVDKEKWNSSNPTGAIVLFEATSKADDSPVFASKSTSNYWVFTPLSTTWDWEHPLAGHRQFGLTKNQDGTYTFYTRGIDRLYDWEHSAANYFFNSNGDWFFQQADKLWNYVMDKIVSDVKTAGGDAQKTHDFSRRINWKKDAKEGKGN